MVQRLLANQTIGQAWAANRLGLMHLLLAMPMLMIGGFAVAGVLGLAIAALLSTTVLSVAALRPSAQKNEPLGPLMPRARLVNHVETCLSENKGGVGVFTLEIDRFKSLTEQFDHQSLGAVVRQCAQRLADNVRPGDLAAQIDRSGFVVITGPGDDLDLEAAIQIATRLQSMLSKPIQLADGQIQMSISIGFCLSNRLRKTSAEGLFLASTTAMIEAQRNGPSAIRSYSDTMRDRIVARRNLARDVDEAFETGQITAHFQPQIATDDRRITGFEALARWHHPRQGPVSPADFLPAMRDAGALPRLGQLMIRRALEALSAWDEKGFYVPRVAVNFSSEELSRPGLVDDIRAELLVRGLSANRLGIEVLETVIASEVNSTVIENLAALADLGCSIDLDDFGTGHASITSIRQFSIGRIKIDRSFVSQIDEDREQQNMVSAILTMAERLGVDSLAEGVETQSEETMLARLGCGHIQGFGVAHPMPLEETEQWIAGHVARINAPSPVITPAMRPRNTSARAAPLGKTA